MTKHSSNRFRFLSGIFGLDLRSLAAFRVGLALFVLYDLISRSFDLTAHYTDLGVAPRAFLIQNLWRPGYFSLHMATGGSAGILAIFVIHAIAAIALLVGYRTRLMSFVVWFLLASLHTRNPLVLSGGDDLLRVISFFAIFLPLGARGSIDAALDSTKAQPGTNFMYTSPATAVYYLQFIAFYSFSALLKTGPAWRTDGTAIYYALNIDQYVLPLGKALLHYPAILKVLTFTVWWVELLGAFILLIPHPLAKIAGVVLFAVLQLGFAATLLLGHFPWVNAIALLPFLPGMVWNRRLLRQRKPLPKVEIIFDGDCGFCRKLVWILVEFGQPSLISAPRAAQKHEKDLALLRRENSWIVRDESGAPALRYDALVRMMSSSSRLSWTVPLLRLKPIRTIGDMAYRFVAGHRAGVAAVLPRFHSRPVELKLKWWREALAVFFFAGALVSNLEAFMPLPGLGEFFEFPTIAARLEQYWGMFAPSPTTEDGWYVVDGKLADGRQVEAFREKRQISFEKPRSAFDFYSDDRWRRFMMNIWLKDFRNFRLSFAAYVCGNWNGVHSGPDRLEQVSVFFMLERTPPPGGQSSVEKLNLIDYPCQRAN